MLLEVIFRMHIINVLERILPEERTKCVAVQL